ncbi:hypothetical protein Droror1_Dr00023403 [Drosera rotundifolia]
MSLMPRRPKWAAPPPPPPPPPPTPRILNLPRLPRRKRPTRNGSSKPDFGSDPVRGKYRKLETVFDRGRRSSSHSHWVLHCGGGEKRWRVERTLQDSHNALVSGKKKIREGRSLNEALQEEMEEMANHLVVLKRSPKQDVEIRGCNKFDKRSFMLQRKLEKLDSSEDVKTIRETKEMARAGAGARALQPHRKEEPPELEVLRSVEKHTTVSEVERLRRNMEELSRGKFKKMEQGYGRMLDTSNTTANGSVDSSATPSRQYEHPNLPSHFLCPKKQDSKPGNETACSGHCKAVVKRIMDQVRADTEHWTQMQGMLEQVKEEMEELQASRDFWKDRAICFHSEMQSLHASVQEWRKRAASSEMQENKLQDQVRILQRELENLRIEKEREPEAMKSKELKPVSRQATPPSHDKENRVLTCHVKGRAQSSHSGREKLDGSTDRPGNLHNSSIRLVPLSRLPLRDIKNFSPLANQNNKSSISPFHLQC